MYEYGIPGNLHAPVLSGRREKQDAWRLSKCLFIFAPK